MSITAKFAGRCTRCTHSIVVGSTIEWQKGVGSHHVDCARAVATATAGAGAATTTTRAPGRCACGRAITGSYTRCYRCAERAGAVKCSTCGGTPGTRGRYGQYTGGSCQCCRPHCKCYDCAS